MKKTILKNYKRHDITKLLNGNNNIGVELGVAQGTYAKRLINSSKFSYLIGIDSYEDHHDLNEYKTAIQNIGHGSNYKILRMRFEDALDLFDDNSLDFVYVDGYAGNGELGGKTIHDWFSKVKIGGMIAGDDYDITHWPLVVDVVNHFCIENDFELLVTDTVEPDEPFCKHPTWAVIKTSQNKATVREDFVNLANEYDRKRREKREQKLKNKKEKNDIKRIKKNKN